MDIYGRPDSDANGLLCCPDSLDDLLDQILPFLPLQPSQQSSQPSQQSSQPSQQSSQLSQQSSQLDIYPF